MSSLYPAFLKLAGRRCVVVGGGAVAERKVRGLLAADADVLVVAPEATPALDELAVRRAIRVEQRPYRTGDLAGAFLVVAATDSRVVNETIVRDAWAVGALVNVVDDPAACDVTVPAIVRRGDVTLAISTGGRSPGFARYLREELEDWLSDERLALLDLVADVRAELRAAGANPGPERWRQAVRSNILEGLITSDRAAARRSLLAALVSPPLAAPALSDRSPAASPDAALQNRGSQDSSLQRFAPQTTAPQIPAPQAPAPQATSRRCS